MMSTHNLSSLTRRRFLGRTGGAAAATVAAGVHWRSDADGGLRLGEEVAIQILTDMKGCFNEEFAGFSLTKFDGT